MPAPQSVTLAYGARTAPLLIYRDVVERCVRRVPSLDVTYFVEHPARPRRRRSTTGCGARRAASRWQPSGRRLRGPFEATYYISGPPPMLRGIGDDLRARNIAPEAIHIDAWE